MKYFNKFFPLLFLLATFFQEFIKSNLSVAYIVLFIKRSQIDSKIISYDTRDLSHFEVLVLAQMITLTPGTIAATIDGTYSEIRIHILTRKELSNNTASRIDKGLKTALLRLTR